MQYNKSPNSLMKRRPRADQYPVAPQSQSAQHTEEDAPETDFVQIIHRHLRGHYRLAAALALVGGMIGAIIGWHFNPPQYRSEGCVRIAYSLPLGAASSGQQMPMALFDAFIRSQQVEMTSRIVVDQAMDDPAWRAMGRAKTADEMKNFAENLSTDHQSSSDLLHIYFTDPDPQAAAAAVEAVINVYSKIFDAQQAEFNQKMIRVLQDQESAKAAEQQEIQSEIASEDGSGSVQAECDQASLDVDALTKKLTEARWLLSLAQNPGAASGDGTNLPTDPSVISDDLFRKLLTDRNAADNALRRLQADGYGDTYPEVQTMKQKRDDIDQQIVQHANDLRSNMTQIENDLVKARETLTEKSNLRLKIQSQQASVDQVSKDYMDLDSQIQTLQVEQRAGSRLTVISSGDVPLLPEQKESRRFIFMGGGAAIGGLSLVLILMLTRMARPRYWSSDEAESDVESQFPLLGILPTLTEQSQYNHAGTAHCIHQMRVMLEVGRRDLPPAFLLTSSAPGEGKTGLTAALALSFAISGSRTLVIDADLIGRGLTSGYDADAQPGLYEALAEGTINGYARETTTAGLWLLPAGQVNGDGAARLAANPVQRLLEEARQSFDVILIDSGPILGSVEASVIAQKVDGVVFVVSRGQQRPLVKRAINHLRVVGAHISGVVFNRADAQEFAKVAHMPSIRTRPNQGANGWNSNTLPQATASAAGRKHGRNAPPLGPLVKSVSTYMAAESA